MAKRNKGISIFDNAFSSTASLPARKANIRAEREVKDYIPLLNLNFKDFDRNQCPPGQTFEEWQKSGRLAQLMIKFEAICKMTRPEAEANQVLKVYGKFPSKSDFVQPAHIQGDVEWGTIQKIGGQKPRLAGYIIGNTFYPVFLDENHRFYISEKKHT